MASWTRFTWDLALIRSLHQTISPFSLVRADEENQDDVITVVSKAAALDSSLMEGSPQIANWAKEQLPEALENPSTCALAVFHGQRIIAASIVSTDPDAECQLITGPSVVSEYRGRGIGKWLLTESLLLLKEAGLTQANAMAKTGSVLARYIYPKSGATSSPSSFRIVPKPRTTTRSLEKQMLEAR